MLEGNDYNPQPPRSKGKVIKVGTESLNAESASPYGGEREPEPWKVSVSFQSSRSWKNIGQTFQNWSHLKMLPRQPRGLRNDEFLFSVTARWLCRIFRHFSVNDICAPRCEADITASRVEAESFIFWLEYKIQAPSSFFLQTSLFSLPSNLFFSWYQGTVIRLLSW